MYDKQNIVTNLYTFLVLFYCESLSARNNILVTNNTQITAKQEANYKLSKELVIPIPNKNSL